MKSKIKRNKSKIILKKYKNKFILFACLILIIVLIILVFFIKTTPKIESGYGNFSENTAVRIIDGDTFELFNKEIIRLICVDAPEKGKEGYKEATDFLSSLILYKEVRLEKDIDDKDKYGRLLRYAYVFNENQNNEIFVNKEIIKNNHGKLFLYGNNTAKCGEIANE